MNGPKNNQILMKHLNHITLGFVITFVLAGWLATPAKGDYPFTSTGSLRTARFGHTATLLPNGKVLVAAGQNIYPDETGEFGHFDDLTSAELYDPATGLWSPTGNSLISGINHTAILLPNGKVLFTAGALYDPATRTWSLTGSLGTAHQGATTTLLANGKVLVAGGSDYNGILLRSAELYNPAAGTWSSTGSLGTARRGATATLLSNGKVLVAGGKGTNGVTLGSAELYDPATGAWSNTGSLGAARQGATATLLPNGKVLFAGGNGTNGVALSSVELYDPATGSWSPTASLLFKRSGHSATLLTNGKVLVAGYVPYAELYDPVTGAWSYTGDAPENYGQTTTRLADGKVLFAGGNYGFPSVDIAELYDPTVPFLHTRYDHKATLLPNGKVFIAGGWDPTAELDDPTTGARSYTASLGTLPRPGATATLLPSGKVLVAGTFYFPEVTSAELYDPATGTWTPTAGLAHPRFAHTATLLPNGKVLVAGGVTNYDATRSAELYNPATGTWSFTGSLATDRQGATTTLLPNGKVLVAGGSHYDGILISSLASAELYNPATGTWSPTGNLAAGRYWHTATLLPNGKVLVAGGYDPNNYPNSYGVVASAELYDPATGAWLPDANLSTPRYDHTATLLTNGMMFIAGGNQAGSFAELYDPTRSFINPIFNPARLGDGSFQFHFTGNPSGTNCRVLASPNAAAPLNTWSNLGPATETPPGSGQFQFTDHHATNSPRRFYRVRSP